MPKLPRITPHEDADPHIVIIGAGGSRAACPNGDRNGRRLPLMADLVEVVGLRPLLESAGLDSEGSDFEALYDRLLSSAEHRELASWIEDKVRAYFAAIELPDSATVYDYLLLSLRPKDLIATFNWDPLLTQAFRRHEGRISLPQLAFLHGNVAVGFCPDHRRCGWYDDVCVVCEQAFTPSPLLFPVRTKDYKSRPFIASQWALLEDKLARAYFVTIFGYSAPLTDAAARETMHSVWSRNETREIAETELIDLKPRNELHRHWEGFITGSHYITTDSVFRSYTSWHPRRSCDALFAATMQNDPFRDDWLPQCSGFEELRQWVVPLYREEINLDGTNEYFSGRPCREYHEKKGVDTHGR